MSNIRIDETWKKVLEPEFNRPYFQEIASFLRTEKSEGKTIFPPGNLLFNAFDSTPFPAVKVVILGQDPYHNPGEAVGLSFSVPRGVRTPPSLLNIYKEIQRDLGFPVPKHGDLTSWAQQGVFLLNAMLSVEAHKAASHQTIGWQLFTDAVIRKLSEERKGIVFMLWGNFAKRKRELIDENKHLVLEAAHPSPLARDAFSGCKHFSKANEYLESNNQTPINWKIED
jgi:uracil-DNA glycosylase